MRRRRDLATCLAAASFGFAQWPASAGAAGRLAIPFEINDFRHMVVAIEVNGVATSTGVLDTAATYMMIDSATAQRGGIDAPGDDAPHVTILGLNGERDYPVVRIDRIAIGNLQMAGLNAAWSPDIDIPGTAANVLPSSAFPGDVLEFDFDKGLIVAYDGRPQRRSTEQSDRLDYELIDGLMFIDVRINGRKGRALVDTGSNLTYVNSAYAALADLPRDRDRTKRLLGVTGDSSNVWITNAKKVSVADFSVSRLDLLVSDPALFDQLGFAGEPLMVIGLDVLSQFRVQIDRSRQQIVLSVPGSRLGGMRTGSSVSGSRIGN